MLTLGENLSAAPYQLLSVCRYITEHHGGMLIKGAVIQPKAFETESTLSFFFGLLMAQINSLYCSLAFAELL